MSRFLLSSACLVSVLAAGGCSDDDGQPLLPPARPGGATGTLVFDWSIEGRQDAEACIEVGAATFDAIIVDESFVIADLSVPCEDFEARIDLYADDFLSRSSLLDERRAPALGRIIEDLFVIDAGQVTRLVMDFPSAPLPMVPAPDAGVADAGPEVPPDVTPDAATPPDAGTPPSGEPPDDGTPDAGAEP